MEPNTSSREKCCAQCGRIGTRGFKTLGGPFTHKPSGAVFDCSFTVCANENACRKRWPKPSEEYLDRMAA